MAGDRIAQARDDAQRAYRTLSGLTNVAEWCEVGGYAAEARVDQALEDAERDRAQLKLALEACRAVMRGDDQARELARAALRG